MWRVVTFVPALVACNQVFNLDQTEPLEELDSDGDRVVDSLDNCPDTFNELQSDTDGDTIGNACDNCPLISNIAQRAVGDRDAIGDACDPHPAEDGDCLIVIDTFEDPDRLRDHWQVITLAGSTSEVTAETGRILIRPSVGDVVALAARGGDGELLTAIHDVQFRGTSVLGTGGALYAVTGAAVPSMGHFCGLRYFAPVTNLEIGVAAAVGGSTSTNFGLGAPIDPDFVIRMTRRNPTTQVPDSCRVDYGVALGTEFFPVTQRPVGWSGVRVVGSETEITGIALMDRVDGGCPPTLAW